MGISRTEDGDLQLALKHPGTGRMIGMIMRNKKAIKSAAVDAVVGHTLAGTAEGDTCIKEQTD